MVSHETRAGSLGLAGLLCCVAVAVVVTPLPTALSEWGPALAFVLVTIFGFIIPQVYFLRVDDTVPLGYRVGFLALVTLSTGLWLVDSAAPASELVIRLVMSSTVVALLLWQARVGYQRAMGDSPRQ